MIAAAHSETSGICHVCHKDLPQHTCLDERYQRMAIQYFRVQATYRQTRIDFEIMQREYWRLHNVVQAKQEAIEVLLPYYPYPLSEELAYKIDLR